MAKNYSYVVDHDTGFAPKIHNGKTCTLSGCKPRDVEKNADNGSWVLGTGGVKTGQSKKIIYFMEVTENYPIKEFKKQFPEMSKYLEGNNRAKNVLLSNNFYYFGDHAIEIPSELESIIKKYCGSKCFLNEDKDKLLRHLAHWGYKPGIYGKPNNLKEKKSC